MTSLLQGGACPFDGKYFDQRVYFHVFSEEKIFLYNNGQKYVFVSKYFILALKLFTVFFKRSDKSISSDDT